MKHRRQEPEERWRYGGERMRGGGRRSSRKGENERKERLKYGKDRVSLDLLIKPSQTTANSLRPLRAYLRINRAAAGSGLQGWQNNQLAVWHKNNPILLASPEPSVASFQLNFSSIDSEHRCPPLVLLVRPLWAVEQVSYSAV